MPRSTRIVTYGPEYEQLLLLAFAAEGEKRFPLPSYSLALSLKMRVYAYFKALRTERSRPDLIEKADQLSVRVDGPDLILFRREDAWDKQLLRSAMGLEKGFADSGQEGILIAKSPTDLLMEKLATLRQEKARNG